MEEYLQTEWPDLHVRLTSVTEQWATVAVVGPNSRAVVAALTPDLAVDAQSFPFMAIREARVAGTPARVVRVSFSGELAYEINVPAWYGLSLWEAVMAAGEPFDITPYGTEAMHVLRAEKGYIVVGHETDGTVTPFDLGMDWVVSKKKPFFIGRRSFSRADTSRPDRKQLVGLLPDDPQALIPEGAQLVLDPAEPVPMTMVGHVTSSYRSAALGRTFALALVRSGRECIGETVYAPLIEGTVSARVVPPIFYDPEGKRRDG
jgi:sarcosine oxidase subunit alpha